MNILINCSNIKIGGGIQVAHSFIHELLENKKHSFVIILSTILEGQIDKKKFSANFTFFTYDINASPKNTIFSENSFLEKIVRTYEINKVFTVFGPAYWKPSVPHICGYAKPQYIYKNSPFFQIISFKNKLLLKLKEFFQMYDFKYNSDILITENPDVSARISKRLNKKVYTVTNNYNQVFDRPENWIFFNLPQFSGDYILTISANYPHKNLQVIPNIIDILQKRNIRKFKFVVTLEENSLTTDLKINEDIIYIGKVAINQCPSLYQQSKYMFLPTLLECFSASYAEAMKMEKIILTSDLEFARGICKDAAIYFNPLDTSDIVNKLLAIDMDTKLQKIIVEKGIERLLDFDSSKQRAEKYLEIISKA
jgi:glycosyltransferase involved in cell wall biosynthesis